MKIARCIALAVWLSPLPAAACPCGTADPVLSQPAPPAGPRPSFRLGAEARLMLDAYGAGADRADVIDVRLESSIQVTPIEILTLSLTAPVVYREVTRANFSHERVVALADPELRARLRLMSSGDVAIGLHLLDVLAGIDLPVMPDVPRPDGEPLSMEAMVASGSADPLVGLLYRFAQGPFHLATALTWRFPTTGHAAMTMGPSLDATLLAGGVLFGVLTLRGAVETRMELAARMPEGVMPNTGGALVRVGGDVVVQPMPGLSVGAGIRGPVVDAMNGDRDPGITASAFVIGEVTP